MNLHVCFIAAIAGPVWQLTAPAQRSDVTGAGEAPAACCVGSECNLLTRAECAEQAGSFVEGAIICVPSICSTGVCCTPDVQCIDDDGTGGLMDELLCNDMDGTFRGGASCESGDPCGTQDVRIPEGYEIIEILVGEAVHDLPALNDCGEVAFTRGGRADFQEEVFVYDNGLATRRTENVLPDSLVSINDDGVLTWTQGWNGRDDGQIILDRGIDRTQLGVGVGRSINDTNQVAWVWEDADSPVCPSPRHIYYYNGGTTLALSTGAFSNQGPAINNREEIVWTRYDFPSCEFTQNWTSHLIHYYNGVYSLLPTLSTQCQSVDLNHNGMAAWSCAGGIQLWDPPDAIVFSVGHDANPKINDNGEIYFIRFHENVAAWQPWLYRPQDETPFYRLLADDVWNTDGDINNAGEAVWSTLGNPNLGAGRLPSSIRYLRRIRTGDVDLDNDVDRADFAYFPGCYTGSIPTDRLCQCRFLDIDHDRDVDDDDFTLFMQNYTGPLDACDGNGTLDFEDILYAETPDCNQNGIPDSCDLSAGSSVDDDADGVVDDFAAKKVKTPWLEVFPTWTNRYLHMIPRNQGIESAIRVTLTQVNGFDSFNGQVRWVGPPAQYPEEDSSDPKRTFIASSLQCAPHFMDWSLVDKLYVFGAEIVPGSSYEIQEIGMGCAVNVDDESAYSEFPVTIRTATWGDVAEPFATTEGAAAQPDFTDIAALVTKFTADPQSPDKARMQLQPNTPDPSQPITFSDIAAVVDAFTGALYPFAGPTECP